MNTETVIKQRERLAKLVRKNRNDGVERPPAIAVECDNSFGFNTAINPVQWIDEEEIVLVFTNNSYDIQGSVPMSFGGKVLNSGLCIIVHYEQIQQIKLVMQEEDFDNLCDRLNEDRPGTISDTFRENTRMKLFKSTDPVYIIEQGMKTHY